MVDSSAAPMQRPMPTSLGWRLVAWRLFGLPGQILAIGLTVIVLLELAQLLHLTEFLRVGSTSAPIIAILIFMVGVVIIGFLWYLTHQGFQLLRDPTILSERIGIMKDLPLGLPEGTVRAVLALIVGMVGLPMLLFMSPLEIPEATAALVANIITGVFAFYFGQRSAGGDAQTAKTLTRTIGTLQADKDRLQTSNADLNVVNDTLKTVTGTTLGESVASQIDRIDRYLGLADTLSSVLGPLLPKGLVPAQLGALITQARNVAAGAKSLSQGELSKDSLDKLKTTADSLLGGTGLGGLLGKAGGALLPMLGVAGPAAGVALLLSLGWKLESEQYQRWRARILGAPWDPALIKPGRISTITAETRLPACPIFNAAFASRKDQPGFYVDLINDVLADDAMTRLWRKYGGDPTVFADQGVLRDGLAEFRLALLADQSASDIAEEQVAAAVQALNDGLNPATRPGNTPSPADINKILDQNHTRWNVAMDDKAALHALVMLVGVAREKKIDLPKLLSELPQ